MCPKSNRPSSAGVARVLAVVVCAVTLTTAGAVVPGLASGLQTPGSDIEVAPAVTAAGFGAPFAGSDAGPVAAGEHTDGVANSNATGAGGNDTTVRVIITFDNDSARRNVSFDENVTVTGGEGVETVPVLFATVERSVLPAIRATPGVESASVDRQIELPGSSDSSVPEVRSTGVRASGQAVPWGLRRIDAPEVADHIRATGTRNVTVAVVDSGVDYDHPDLSGSVVWGANFTRGTRRYGVETADDNSGHGTAVAGIIAARDNDGGVVGVAPGTRLYAIKVLDANTRGTVSSLIRGIDAAVAGPDGIVGTDDDADVVHMSVGTTADSDELAAAVAAASEHALLVGSAGNLGDGDPETTEVTYPAAYPEVLAVAATDRDNETTSYSSEGPAVDVAAPGSSVRTLASGGDTAAFSGTSAAAPYVSGTVAAMLAADRAVTVENRTNAELRTLLLNASLDIGPPGPDRSSGHGLLRADRAVAAVLASSGTRTVAERTLPGGETTSVEVTVFAAADSLTVSESFAPPAGGAEIDTVGVAGRTRTPFFATANRNRSTVIVDGLDIGARVVVTYTVRVPTPPTANDTYSIAGAVANGETETDLGTVRLTVQRNSTGGIVASYDDDDDGDITVVELGRAAADYASGEISIGELAAVARAL